MDQVRIIITTKYLDRNHLISSSFGLEDMRISIARYELIQNLFAPYLHEKKKRLIKNIEADVLRF